MTEQMQRIIDAHRARFGEPSLLVRSPGRINLIGEHTDYNDGLVLPAAIDRAIWFACSHADGLVIQLQALDIDESYELELDEPLQPSRHRWVNYLMGAMEHTTALDPLATIHGLNVTFGGDLPMGSGLSASAALTAGFACLLTKAWGLHIDFRPLARAAQKAEQTRAGANVGIMDPYTVLFGRSGHALLLDCRTTIHKQIPFPTNRATILLADTGVKHELATSAYNQRRVECERALELLRQADPSIQSLRDVSSDLLETNRDRLGDLLYRRTLHVFTENRRVQHFVETLTAGDLAACGTLLDESHASLRDQYEVSCSEADLLVDLAREQPGVFGARMMGGGFGGMVLLLVDPEATAVASDTIRSRYLDATGVDCKPFAATPADGVEVHPL